MQINSTPLSFRLRPSVRFLCLPDGKALLVLTYPLRAVFIPAHWQPVVACLEAYQWVVLDRIDEAVSQIPADEIEGFLNTLVRKGYVDQKGFLLLEDSDYPSVSAIIPVRNRPEEIVDCLQALTGLDYTADKLEIIVVDDASDDTTPDVVKQFSEVRLLRMRQHRQAAYCRNRAAEIASGEILAFIDSDCLADATWLKELVPAFRDRSIGALGGRVDAASQINTLDRYETVKSALTMGSFFRRSDPVDDALVERFFYVPSCNFLVRRELFAELNGFRETLHVGEDVDFCWRMQDAGHAFEYRPMGKVAHKHRNRIAAFCGRRFDYGTSEPVLQQLHGDRVKTLYLPWCEFLFWTAAILAVLLKMAAFVPVAITLLLVDGHKRFNRLKKRQIPATRLQVLTAVARGYLAFVFHCFSFISRYYLVIVPMVMLLSPSVAAVILIMHLIVGIVEFAIKKPRLNVLLFLLYFTLEQISYQCGVWWSCVRQVNFKPVFPRIISKLT